MNCRTLGSLAGAAATLGILAVGQLRGQEACVADADSGALADNLLRRVGEQFEGGERTPAMWSQARRALEVAPLNRERLEIILQLAHFLNRPDSAIAWANLARERWPSCILSDSALVRARALPPERRGN